MEAERHREAHGEGQEKRGGGQAEEEGAKRKNQRKQKKQKNHQNERKHDENHQKKHKQKKQGKDEKQDFNKQTPDAVVVMVVGPETEKNQLKSMEHITPRVVPTPPHMIMKKNQLATACSKAMPRPKPSSIYKK